MQTTNTQLAIPNTLPAITQITQIKEQIATLSNEKSFLSSTKIQMEIYLLSENKTDVEKKKVSTELAVVNNRIAELNTHGRLLLAAQEAAMPALIDAQITNSKTLVIRDYQSFFQHTSNTPSIAQIKRYKGEQTLRIMLIKWLDKLMAYLGANKNLISNEILSDLVNDIILDYPQLTIADLKLFEAKAKKMEFKLIYNSLSAANILNWLQQYWVERIDNCVANSLRKHQEATSGSHYSEYEKTTKKQEDTKRINAQETSHLLQKAQNEYNKKHTTNTSDNTTAA